MSPPLSPPEDGHGRDPEATVRIDLAETQKFEDFNA
jgi:hypothetical protein